MLVPLLDLAWLLVIIGHCYVSPFTKVEESFNMQAVHDLVTYGLDLSQFDHRDFPGAVKRTFVGSGVLASLLKPFTLVYEPELTYLDYQLFVRVALGVANWIAVVRLRKTLYKVSSDALAPVYFAALQYSQFHITYYASRTLPNFIALPLTNLALVSVLGGNFNRGLAMLAFSAAVFRAEIGVFAVSIAFVATFSYQLKSVPATAGSMVAAGAAGLVVTTVVDSYFWSSFPTVPELSSILFNVYEGNSKLWGTEPFDAYFSRYFLTIFCPPSVLILGVIGTLYRTTSTKVNTVRTIGLGSFLFVLLLSFQPHKEWRFIIYAVPGLTLLATSGVVGLARVPKLRPVVQLFVFATAVASFFISLFMLYISSLNYPGGVAITALNERLVELDQAQNAHAGPKSQVTVHLDVPACMTGITLFTYLKPDALEHLTVVYDKEEDELALADVSTWQKFDYVITDADLEDGGADAKLPVNAELQWDEVERVRGYAGVDVLPLLSVLRNQHLLARILKDVARGDFSPVVQLLEGTVRQNDKLHIYARRSV